MNLKDLQSAFSKESRLKSAFRAVRIDMDLLNEKNDTLKQSANDWIVFLSHENQELKTRVKELERKLSVVERSVDHEKMAILREI
jgi:hypothetical protein